MKKKAVNPAIGQRMAQIRLARGITQKDFAAKLKISRTMLQHYERGRAELSASRIDQAADMLDCKAADLHRLPGAPIPRRMRHPARGWSRSFEMGHQR